MDLPPGESDNCLAKGNVKGKKEDIVGGMAKLLGQMNVDAAPITASSAMTGPGSAHGRFSVSNGGSTSPASAAGSTATNDEWAFVNAARKGKSYGNSSSLTVGAPGYTTPATIEPASRSTSTARSTARNVGGWVKEKNRPPIFNEWGRCAGGQPRLFKKTQSGKKNNEDEDEGGRDDGEEI